MTTYTVSVAKMDISDYVKQIEFWRQPLPFGIGRFKVFLDNSAGDLSGLFQGDDEVLVECGTSNIPFAGYVDLANPQVQDVLEAHFMRTFILSGRDVGQDLMNKSIEMYKGGEADAIITELLTQTDANINFTFPGSSPSIFHNSKGWAYLIDQINSILSQINYEGAVYRGATAPYLDIKEVGTASSGITLKSIFNDPTNNIIKLLDHTETDSVEQRNVIIAFGPEVDDHYTELNAAGFAILYTGNAISDYIFADEAISPPRISSLGAIKVVQGSAGDIGCKLTFPKYFVQFINWQYLENGKLSFAFYSSLNSPRVVYINFVDSDSNVISTYVTTANNAWTAVSVGIGSGAGGGDVAWSGDTADFIWGEIVEMRFYVLGTVGAGNFFLFDLLKMPQRTYAVADHSGGFGGNCPICGEAFSTVLSKHLPVSKEDAASQIELEAYAEDLADKRMNPLGKLHLIADGEAGIISGAWKWFPGWNVTVNVPEADIEGAVYRMIDLHHVIAESTGNDPKHTVELQLIPYNQIVDSQQWSYTKDGRIALIRRLHDRLRWIENKKGYTP